MQELRLNSLLFEQYFRMAPEYFDELLGKVDPLITRAGIRHFILQLALPSDSPFAYGRILF